MKPVVPEDPVHRFPRTDNVVTLYVAKLRIKYPAPSYNWRYDGSTNPADIVLQSLVEASKKKLRRLCGKHSLETWGNKRRLIKRMYLHWRASKMNLGDPQIGYGKGYESTRNPTCVCGFRKRVDLVAFEKRKEDAKEQRIKQRKKLEGIWNKVIEMASARRFPRLLFPRFRDKKRGEEYYRKLRLILKRKKW
jgi:hypothetical protein